jgi:hypothetical protein
MNEHRTNQRKDHPMNASDVLDLWRSTPAAADWGEGRRVKFCSSRRGIYAIHDDTGILGLVDVTGPQPKVQELFDPEMQHLLLSGLWHELL